MRKVKVYAIDLVAKDVLINAQMEYLGTVETEPVYAEGLVTFKALDNTGKLVDKSLPGERLVWIEITR